MYKYLNLLKMMMSFLLLLNVVSALDLRTVFENWASGFHIRFSNDLHQESVFSKWLDNHYFIERVNAQNKTYTLGHNQFSGMNTLEFSKFLAGSYGLGERYGTGVFIEMQTNIAENLKTVPASVDWVAKGAVTPVKDQGQCGSCWSFSTSGALEGAYYIKYGTLPSFSEQQLVDCDNLSHGGRDHGCNGGLMDNAFNWIGKNGGLCTEAEYPYVSGVTKTAGDCQTGCKLVSGSKVVGHTDVSPNSDDAMMTAIAKQPVSIAIEADQREFQLYKSGVFTGTCGTNLDHGVLVVGYGTMNGLDYYRVKNSWSTTWGADGYIYLGRGPQYNQGSGQCGILMQGSYPSL